LSGASVIGRCLHSYEAFFSAFPLRPPSQRKVTQQLGRFTLANFLASLTHDTDRMFALIWPHYHP
jgi:hypothetical protein